MLQPGDGHIQLARSSDTNRAAMACIGLLLLTTVAETLPAGDAVAPAGTSEAVALGEALFLHNWARPHQWTRAESLGDGGDGLGPLFNDVSCVACHAQGGVGGSGDNGHNVELFSIRFPPRATVPQRLGLVKRARVLHPGFRPDRTSLILHHFGFGEQDDVGDYDTWRESLAVSENGRGRLVSKAPFIVEFDGVLLQRSFRSTPALWGTREIEMLRVTGGDEIRREIAVAQNGSSTGISGRLPRTETGQVAWYGWRGHVSDLHEFVQSACASELGLSVPRHVQPTSPMGLAGRRLKRTSLPPLDLTGSQVSALTRYVSNLPRPGRVYPLDQEELADVYSGEHVFEVAGCAECHVPQLGSVKEIYTDFLLHDMGRSLSDPVTANPEPTTRRMVRSTQTSWGYAGGSRGIQTAVIDTQPVTGPKSRPRLSQEWRTPPLWAVADTGPYLHDGRAETIDEAIRLHEGEAKPAAEAYQSLSEYQRSQLLSFLGTLRAPDSVVAVATGSP